MVPKLYRSCVLERPAVAAASINGTASKLLRLPCVVVGYPVVATGRLSPPSPHMSYTVLWVVDGVMRWGGEVALDSKRRSEGSGRLRHLMPGGCRHNIMPAGTKLFQL